MLAPDQWPRVRALLEEVVDWPADDRRAYFANACGSDSDVRLDVESLLRAHDAAGGFLAGDDASSSHGRVGFTRAPALDAGTRLGAYEIEVPLGAGGVGEISTDGGGQPKWRADGTGAVLHGSGRHADGRGRRPERWRARHSARPVPVISTAHAIPRRVQRHIKWPEVSADHAASTRPHGAIGGHLQLAQPVEAATGGHIRLRP
jgi:hypothetical protein